MKHTQDNRQFPLVTRAAYFRVYHAIADNVFKASSSNGYTRAEIASHVQLQSVIQSALESFADDLISRILSTGQTNPEMPIQQPKQAKQAKQDIQATTRRRNRTRNTRKTESIAENVAESVAANVSMDNVETVEHLESVEHVENVRDQFPINPTLKVWVN